MSTKRKPEALLHPYSIHAKEITAAQSEDVVVAAALRRARLEPRKLRHTVDSIQQNELFMEKMHVGSARAMARRIESRELISKDELIQALGGKKRWVSEALKAGRLFSLTQPTGGEYFPVFFADERYDRRALGRVVRALGSVPSESKAFFLLA